MPPKSLSKNELCGGGGDGGTETTCARPRLRRLTNRDARMIFGFGDFKTGRARCRQRHTRDRMRRGRQRRAGGEILIAGQRQDIVFRRRFILCRGDFIARNVRRQGLRLDGRQRNRGDLRRHGGDGLRTAAAASGSAPKVGAKRRALGKRFPRCFQRKGRVDEGTIDICRDMRGRRWRSRRPARLAA